MYKMFVLDYLHKQVELLVMKSREHDQDLIRIMDEQLQLRQQYPLQDIKVVPTNEQIGVINETANLQSKSESGREPKGNDGKSVKRTTGRKNSRKRHGRG